MGRQREGERRRTSWKAATLRASRRARRDITRVHPSSSIGTPGPVDSGKGGGGGAEATRRRGGEKISLS